MTSVDHLRDVLHLAAGLLVWPVLLGLLALAGAIIVSLGAFAREGLQRMRGASHALDRDLAILADAVRDRPVSLPAGDERDDEPDLRLEAALQQAERRRWRALSRVRMAVRLGPALGLMGTLIPMANALQGLADGNLPALAGNMVTAFAATVIGLAVSVIAFLMAAVREEWVRADVARLTMAAERLSREPLAERDAA